jgi:hypothetical protein
MTEWSLSHDTQSLWRQIKEFGENPAEPLNVQKARGLAGWSTIRSRVGLPLSCVGQTAEKYIPEGKRNGRCWPEAAVG